MFTCGCIQSGSTNPLCEGPCWTQVIGFLGLNSYFPLTLAPFQPTADAARGTVHSASPSTDRSNQPRGQNPSLPFFENLSFLEKPAHDLNMSLAAYLVNVRRGPPASRPAQPPTFFMDLLRHSASQSMRTVSSAVKGISTGQELTWHFLPNLSVSRGSDTIFFFPWSCLFSFLDRPCQLWGRWK